MKNTKKTAILTLMLLFVVTIANCPAQENNWLKVGETIPNPMIEPITHYQTDRIPGPYNLYDYKGEQLLLIAFMPSVDKRVEYADVMTGSFDSYFAKGLSFRSFSQYVFTNPQMKVMIVTPDSKEQLNAFLQSNNEDFEFISDTNYNAAQLFGMSKPNGNFDEKYIPSAAVFLVDKNNKIIFTDHDYRGQGEKLKTLQSGIYTALGLKEDLTGNENFAPLITGDEAREFDFRYVTVNPNDVTPKPYQVYNAKLSDYIGKKNVLIAFYPAAYSYSCAFEAATIDHWAEERLIENVKSNYTGNDDLEILMVSISNEYILAKWRKDLNLNSVKMVIDSDGSISRKYSSYNPLGYNKRTVFLVDKTGKISYINWDYKVDEVDFAKLKESVLALN